MSKKIITLGLFAGAFLLFFMIACDKKVGKPIGPPAALTANPGGFCDTITYNKHIGPIIQTNCATTTGCHASGAPQVNLLNYSSVKGIGESGKLKTRVIDGPNFMPPTGQLPADQKNLIQCWINNGFKEQ
ncbi:MAG: hypothetical protein K0S12_1885 [Bacteroidetes bacterium]|jgi:hypothetical protein|nr:hypothetical protein [Bacteroidota bacterium]